MDVELPPGLLIPFTEQGGVFSTAQARAVGCERQEIARWVRSGRWVRLRRGVFTTAATLADCDIPGEHLVRVRAARLTLRSELAFSHVSAAVLHGLPVHRLDLSEVHVTHPHGAGTGRHESDVWHHTGPLPEQVMIPPALPTVTLARTAFDVGRVAPQVGALVVADAVLARGVTSQQLREQLELGADWPGSCKAGKPLTWADGRSESVGESVARWAFHEAGLAPDELQWQVLTDQGPYRTDFAWTSWRVVGEFDGRIKYGRLCRPGESAADVAARERSRELAIERAGWCVVRFTWAEVHDVFLVRQRLLAARTRAQVQDLVS